MKASGEGRDRTGLNIDRVKIEVRITKSTSESLRHIRNWFSLTGLWVKHDGDAR